jgi:hypothetical protein
LRRSLLLAAVSTTTAAVSRASAIVLVVHVVAHATLNKLTSRVLGALSSAATTLASIFHRPAFFEGSQTAHGFAERTSFLTADSGAVEAHTRGEATQTTHSADGAQGIASVEGRSRVTSR